MSTNNIQAYFKVITTTSSDNIVTINKYQIDSNTYANTAATTNNYITANNENVTVKVSKETRSFYEYELEENEKKREIKLIKKEFIPDIEKEFKRVIKS
jgi:Ser-tRNA(Ala) deacylase AlaX